MVLRRKLSVWLRPGGETQPWIDALIAVDRRKDKTALINLLRSQEPCPADARWHVADLLSRYKLVRSHGGRATPSYDRSEMESRKEWAREGCASQ
jgi:hypothetical protein